MKTRFCPSPTGFIHLGNARTALFNALAAKAVQGKLLLRIEDTDKARSSLECAEQLMQDLRWLGLDWQEGPFWQSKRQAIYDNYYDQLLANHRAYYCFCNETQLALNRKRQLSLGQPPRYPGTCRHLSADEVEAKLAEDLKPTLRFKLSPTESIEFDDLVRGKQVFAAGDMGDFIIRRADGSASFMFCNAVDDALMGVTHAMRGEDHLTNSPRQVSILQALELPVPQYAHISLILGKDGAPLSKRNGSRSVKDLRCAGYMPIAIVNHLARLGHYYETDTLLSLAELAQQFSWQRLNKSPAKFDPDQLLRWQKLAVMQCTLEELTTWLDEHQPDLQNLVPEDKWSAFLALIQGNILLPEDARLWVDALFAPQLTWSSENLTILKDAGPEFFKAACQALQRHPDDFKQLAEVVKQATDKKAKHLFMPLRIALTGQAHGPEMAQILNLIGAEQAAARFKQSLEAIQC